MNTNDSKSLPATKFIITLASVVILVAGLKAASSFFIPIMLAFFIATVSFPITNWLRSHGVPRFFAVLSTVLVNFTIIAGVIVFLIGTVGQLQSKWESKYSKAIETKIGALRDNSIDLMMRWNVPEEQAEATVDQYLNAENVQAYVSNIDAQKWLNLGWGTLGTIASFLGTTFIIILLTVFMLNEAKMFGRRLDAVMAARGPNIQRMVSASKDIQRYLGIKTLISAITGGLAYLLCWSMGVDFPELWGMLAFALNYIPAIGSVLAGIPPVLLAILTRDLQSGLLVAGGYLLINGFLGNFLEPTLLGRRFGMSTLVVVLSVIFWGWVWGPAGMLLGVPLTMLLKVALDNSVDFRWIAVAISKEENQPEADKTIIKKAVDKKAMEPVAGESAPAK